MIIGHRGRGGVKGVGLDDIGTRFQVGCMDRPDYLRLGERQKIVIALEVMREIRKTSATVVCLLQLVALDHRAHGTVQQHDAARE